MSVKMSNIQQSQIHANTQPKIRRHAEKLKNMTHNDEKI